MTISDYEGTFQQIRMEAAAAGRAVAADTVRLAACYSDLLFESGRAVDGLGDPIAAALAAGSLAAYMEPRFLALKQIRAGRAVLSALAPLGGTLDGDPETANRAMGMAWHCMARSLSSGGHVQADYIGRAVAFCARAVAYAAYDHGRSCDFPHERAINDGLSGAAAVLQVWTGIIEEHIPCQP